MRSAILPITITAVLTLILLSVAGCSPAGDTGSVRVLVTDKPYPFEYIDSAVITITRIDVRTGDPGEEDESAFITIFEGSREFDLTELQGGQTDLLADATVPEGTYTQMRLYVTEGAVTLMDQMEPITLSVPSGASSGIKLNFTFDVEAGQETALLLDVDMSRAFRPIPAGSIEDPSSIETFQFSPSVAMRLINMVEAGSVAGTVMYINGDAIEGASVTAYDEGENEITSTSTGTDGTYVLSGMEDGTYRVEASATGFLTSEATGVEVTAGQETGGIDLMLQLPE